mmetsp:Transcript_12278/g.12675  ORF Transcript_12278/g.12675 Transcript_12278/m.12675 type:complete len:478 (+) Transcript_12278:23-1456(+)
MGIAGSVSQHSNKDINELRQEILDSMKEEWSKFYSLEYSKMKGEEWYLKVNTGDILLFKCMQVSSSFYKEYQGSHYSHVGIVLKRNGIPYVYESSVGEFIVDVDQNCVKNGVMLSPLKERLYDHYGTICWRHLVVPDRVEGEFETIMEDIIKKNAQKYYGGEIKEYLKGGLNIPGLENDEKFFCSELVAYCYQQLGLLSPDRASNTYLVPDFTSVGYEVTSKTCLRRISPEEAKVKLLRNAHLETEIELLPHWVEEKPKIKININPTSNLKINSNIIEMETDYYPKITEMLEEDLHIYNGLGIEKSELMRLTDCKIYMLIEDIVGMKLNDFGLPTDNFIENLLNPINTNQLLIKAMVGEVPIIPRIPIERGEVNLEVGVISNLPFILNCECEPKYSRLKIWISIQEKDLFSKPDYLGAICIDPHTLPIIGRRKRNNNENNNNDENNNNNKSIIINVLQALIMSVISIICKIIMNMKK